MVLYIVAVALTVRVLMTMDGAIATGELVEVAVVLEAIALLVMTALFEVAVLLAPPPRPREIPRPMLLEVPPRPRDIPMPNPPPLLLEATAVLETEEVVAYEF